MGETRNLRDAKILIQDGSGTPNVIEVTPTKGDLDFTVEQKTLIVMNRGKIDHRKRGDEAPVKLVFSCMFSQWAFLSGASTGISIPDALQQAGGAAAWVSTSPCDPYTVDIVFKVADPCNPGNFEYLTFSKFHADTINFKEGTDADVITVTGEALVNKPNRTYGA